MRYKLAGIKGDVVLIQIVSQNRRRYNFCNQPFYGNKKKFYGNRMILCSDHFPCYSKQTGIVYVRGNQTSKDNNLIELPLNKYKIFQETVREYNNEMNED